MCFTLNVSNLMYGLVSNHYKTGIIWGLSPSSALPKKSVSKKATLFLLSLSYSQKNCKNYFKSHRNIQQRHKTKVN